MITVIGSVNSVGKFGAQGGMPTTQEVLTKVEDFANENV